MIAPSPPVIQPCSGVFAAPHEVTVTAPSRSPSPDLEPVHGQSIMFCVVSKPRDAKSPSPNHRASTRVSAERDMVEAPFREYTAPLVFATPGRVKVTAVCRRWSSPGRSRYEDSDPATALYVVDDPPPRPSPGRADPADQQPSLRRSSDRHRSAPDTTTPAGYHTPHRAVHQIGADSSERHAVASPLQQWSSVDLAWASPQRTGSARRREDDQSDDGDGIATLKAFGQRSVVVLQHPPLLEPSAPFALTLCVVDGDDYPAVLPGEGACSVRIALDPPSSQASVKSSEFDATVVTVKAERDPPRAPKPIPLPWGGVHNVLCDGTAVSKATRSTEWDAHCTTTPCIAAAGSVVGVRFRVALPVRAVVGLHAPMMAPGGVDAWRGYAAAFHFSADFTNPSTNTAAPLDRGVPVLVRVYHGGSLVRSLGTFEARCGDVFQIVIRDTGRIAYLRNDCLLFLGAPAVAPGGSIRSSSAGVSATSDTSQLMCATVKVAQHPIAPPPETPTSTSSLVNSAFVELYGVPAAVPTLLVTNPVVWQGGSKLRAAAAPEEEGVAVPSVGTTAATLRVWLPDSAATPATVRIPTAVDGSD